MKGLYFKQVVIHKNIIDFYIFSTYDTCFDEYTEVIYKEQYNGIDKINKLNKLLSACLEDKFIEEYNLKYFRLKLKNDSLKDFLIKVSKI